MGVNPTFKVVANKQNITKQIQERLISLRVTDEAGDQSDQVEIQIEDRTPHVELPARGATLEIWMGYDGSNQRMGLYHVDEVETSGPPDEITITAKAAPYSTKTGSCLQTQKTRPWPNGTTLGDLLKKIASDQGLIPVISADLARIQLPHVSQTDESDIHLLTRLARQYNATVKPAEGRLVVVKRGAGLTTSGKKIPSVTLNRDQVTNYRASFADRENAGSVTAKYHDPVSGETKRITIGSGEPRQNIRHKYANASAATAAANARLERKQRASTTLSITCPGIPALQAEGKLSLAGFRPGLNIEWTIAKVEHTITASGFSTVIEGQIGALKKN